MDNRIAKDSAYDVPDSTDWLGTPLSALMPVEQAFRCHVCKDFYNSPMLTSCNHTFCSLCIRRCLSVDGKCPLCRALDQESKLRGNWALREAVDAFVKSRPNVLEFARRPIPRAVDGGSPKRKADGEYEDDSVSKRQRMSTRSSKTKAAQSMAAIAREESDVLLSQDIMAYDPDDGLAACPICWTRMKPEKVDKHIDTSCPGSPQPQVPASKATSNRSTPALVLGSTAPSNPPERLPAVNYSILKDNALRKKMSELGLSTSGSRQLLERRHKEWVTIWNANCDSARPKRRSDLLHDLDIWERTLGGRAPTTFNALPGSQIKDKDFDGVAWAAKHDTSFKDLIENARRSRNQAKTKTGEAEKARSSSEEKRTEPLSGDLESEESILKSKAGLGVGLVGLTPPRTARPEHNLLDIASSQGAQRTGIP